MMVKINGVFREVKHQYVKVNGVFREVKNQYVKVNGVFRSTMKQEDQPVPPTTEDRLKESDIKGFKLIYKLNKSKTHSDFPNLYYNEKIPYNISITGVNYNGMNLTDKSVLFEFNRKKYREEGIICYDAELYAITNDNIEYNVTSISNIPPDISDIKYYKLFKNLTISINMKYIWELFGYNLYGWNNLFIKDKFEYHLDPYKPITPGGRKSIDLTNFIILQPEKRSNNYSNIASIGIARAIKTPNNNMVGSKGILDHTISDIMVNGVKKPFLIEILNQ